MTISGTATSIEVDGDDLTVTFSYDFYMGGSSNYAVLVYTDSDGVSTTIPAADFSITGVTSQSGGTFTYPLTGSPIATGETLTLTRTLPLVQNTAVGNQGNLYPAVIEGALDYLTMIAQQQASGSTSSFTIDAASLFGNASSTTGSGSSIGLGSGLSFSGNSLVVSGVSGSGTVTSIATGEGLTGGPITGVGTISLSDVANGSLLGNFSGGADAPAAITLAAGSGITFSGTTTGLTISAVGGGQAMVYLSALTAAVVTASFEFSGVTTSYTHLVIIGSARGSASADSVDCRVQLNGITASGSYNSEINVASGTGTAGAQQVNAASLKVGDLPAANATTGYCGNAGFTIVAYSQTSLFKSIFGNNGYSFSTGSAKTNATAVGGVFVSTAAVTSILIFPSSGSFVTGSQFSVYALV